MLEIDKVLGDRKKVCCCSCSELLPVHTHCMLVAVMELRRHWGFLFGGALLRHHVVDCVVAMLLLKILV